MVDWDEQEGYTKADDEDANQTTITKDLYDFSEGGLLPYLRQELRSLALKGVALKQKHDNAKTQPKRKLYKKKIERNSKRAAEILLYIQRVQQAKQAQQTEDQQEFIHTREDNNDTD